MIADLLVVNSSLFRLDRDQSVLDHHWNPGSAVHVT